MYICSSYNGGQSIQQETEDLDEKEVNKNGTIYCLVANIKRCMMIRLLISCAHMNFDGFELSPMHNKVAH